jgi:YHS domain-containing protein
VDGRVSWVGPEWHRTLDYDDDTLMTHVRLSHEGLALDVICRYVSEYQGVVYRFCSEACKAKFDQQPARFAPSTP